MQSTSFYVPLKEKFDLESKLSQVLGFWQIPPKSIKGFRVDFDKRQHRSEQGLLTRSNFKLKSTTLNDHLCIFLRYTWNVL